MKRLLTRKQTKIRNSMFAIAAALFLLGGLALVLLLLWRSSIDTRPLAYVSTISGTKGEFGEPFGIAVRDNEIYVSDGQNGKIWIVSNDAATVFVEVLATPSAIAFDSGGNLIVVDSGSQTIKSITPKGEVINLAGVEGRSGFADGDSAAALFNAPIGIAIGADGKIFIADTYNDRIRLIENGKVSTLAGGNKGFADGQGNDSQFDTPTGVAIWGDRLLIADTGNRRIRVVEPDGRVWTLAGSGEGGLTDGTLYSASFVQPTSIVVDKNGSIFVTDGNAIRRIGGTIPVVTTFSAGQRGLKDGLKSNARFNRPAGLAIDGDGNLLVADSENRLIRRFSPTSSGHEITAEEIAAMRDKPEEFRASQPARWPFDPPAAKRDIAGTLGEIRGEMTEGSDQVWFHNGLDIAGAYGETARFIRDEKVLRPIAAENFGTLREFIRMPTLGYIHIRLGRNASSEPFGDTRFQFEKNLSGKVIGVRVSRGAVFKAGDPIGTLNAMNHVHLIAGRGGSEMNAIDALALPGLTDSRPPTIEKLIVADINWREIETSPPHSRIRLREKSRIIVRAYDQTDGNSERRRLGVYRVGYQILRSDGPVVADTKWTILFNRLPASEAVSLVYATGSKSGATGETIFNYIATNFADGDDYSERFFDASALENGNYTLRVLAADYFGNTASKDIAFEVVK